MPEREAYHVGSDPLPRFHSSARSSINCGIKVDQAVINALRGQISVSRADSMRWLDDKFEKAAEDAYNEVGRPALLMTVGWSVFSQLIRLEEETEDSCQ